MTSEPNPEHRAAVRIADDQVTPPPSASFMTTVYCEGVVADVDAVIESDQRLILHRGVSVARAITGFKERKPYGLITNFTEKYQHLNKRSAMAVVEETQNASDVLAVADFERAPKDTLRLPHPFDVNPALPQE